MDINALLALRRRYDSYAGTANNRDNKREVSVECFEQVLNTAINNAYDVKELRNPTVDKTVGLSRQQAREDACLYDNDEPDEMKATADFARYG
jgi:hypothetical protein